MFSKRTGIGLEVCTCHIREVKHDVNVTRQTTKITSDFEFLSSNP